MTRGLIRRIALVVLVLALVAAASGVAFLLGLDAGSERNATYRYVKGLKESVQNALRNVDAASAATRPVRIALLDEAGIARAQAGNAPPADLLEWTGFYRIANSAKDLAGFKPINPWLPPVIADRLQPWALAKMETTDGVADDNGQICQPTGFFRTTGFSGSFFLQPARDKVLIVYSPIETSGVQRVYLNRPHPKHLLPTWNGDSIGYWEGDALVVDSIGFNDKSWLQPTMEPHTEEVHLVQRIRRVGNGAFIEVHYTVEDRKALQSAYTYSRYFKRVGDEMPEDICNDDIQMFRDFRNEALKAQFERAQVVK